MKATVSGCAAFAQKLASAFPDLGVSVVQENASWQISTKVIDEEARGPFRLWLGRSPDQLLSERGMQAGITRVLHNLQKKVKRAEYRTFA